MVEIRHMSSDDFCRGVRPSGPGATPLAGAEITVKLDVMQRARATRLAARRGLRPEDIVDEIVRRGLELDAMQLEDVPKLRGYPSSEPAE